MSRKRRSTKQADFEYLEMALRLNGHAKEDGPKRKNWSMHDLKTIAPLTPAQEEMFHAWFGGNNICAHGSAGTGKSFLAFYLALNEVLTQRQSKIILVRSAVPTREVGFLPGTLEEKMMQYEMPYHEILWELVGKSSTYQDMKDVGMIEFHSTSFLRGLTWDNAVVVVDEAENLTFHEVDNVMTRIGQNTRIIFTGDTRQTDLDGSQRQGSEGLSQAMRVFNNMNGFDCVQFNVHDIVRSDVVKSWIMACEEVAA
jgi:phosphate starvation-inducible protein PhoH and related proteins